MAQQRKPQARSTTGLEKKVRRLLAAEDRLKKGKKLLENLIELAPDAIIQTDTSGEIIYANKAFYKAFGFKKKDIIGKTTSVLLPRRTATYPSTSGETVTINESYFEREKKGIEQLFDRGRSCYQNFYVLCSDGRVMPTEQNLFFIKNESREPVGVAGILRDITERVRTFNELRKTRDFLNNIIDNSLDAIIISDETGCIQRANKAFLELIGFPARHIMGKQTAEMSSIKHGIYRSTTGETITIDGRFSAATGEALERLNADGMVRRWHTYLLRRDKTIVPVEQNVSFLHSDEGERIGAVSIIRDITAYRQTEAELKRHRDDLDTLVRERTEDLRQTNEKLTAEIRRRKKIEKKLIRLNDQLAANQQELETANHMLIDREQQVREARDFLENIFSNTLDGIIVSDAGGTIIRVNKAVEELLGFDRSEVLGKSTLAFTPVDENYTTIGQDFAAILFEKGYIDSFETYLKHKDGSLCPVECNITLLKDGGGNITGAVSIIRDIRERKIMEQRLLQTEKLKSLGELAGGVAHDFNNVLAAILGRAQLLMRIVETSAPDAAKKDFREKMQSSLTVIEKAALDGAETVRRIVGFAKKEQEEHAFSQVDLRSLVRDALEYTRPRWKDNAQAQGIRISINRQLARVHPVMGNPAELREVIVNLLNNAIDALPGGGTITAETGMADGRVVLKITDNGTGIKQEIADNIFDPFFTTKGPQSTGLGLSVSYGIIKRHKGDIALQTDTVGTQHLTVFTVTLPAKDAQPKKIKPSPSAPHARSAHILIIEDETEVCLLLADILTTHGHTVDTAFDGAEGLQRFSSSAYDMVMTDLAMPRMSGSQVAEQIKQSHPGIPVLLITGWDVSSDTVHAAMRHVDGVINKPFTVSQINDTVNSVLAAKG